MTVNNVNHTSPPGEVLNNYLNNKIDAFSTSVTIPLIKNSYWLAGKVLKGSASIFSRSWGAKVEEYWHDPISTTKVLTILKPFEEMAAYNAVRKPSERVLFHFVDQSTISVSQQLFVYLKELNHLLSLPCDLKKYIDTLSFDRFINKPSVIIGKKWIWVSTPVILGKQLLLGGINKTLDLIDFAFCSVSFKYKFRLFSYIREIIKTASKATHLTLADIARRVIERREREIRRKIVRGVADASVDYLVSLTSRIAIKTALGMGGYLALRSFAHAQLGMPGYACDIVAVPTTLRFIWQNAIVSNLEPYYKNYQSDFNAEKSNLYSFCNTHSISYLYPPLRALQIYLKEEDLPEISFSSLKESLPLVSKFHS